MANVLLVDPNEIARKALKGILARGNHRCFATSTVREAWDFIHRSVKVDLVFVELTLQGDGGLTLIEQLRGDPLLHLLPVVIYASAINREAVARSVALKVQNFLVKPYLDASVFAEIAKARSNPWRNQHFEEENSFCKMMGLTPPELHRMLDELRTAVTAAVTTLAALAQHHDTPGAMSLLDELSARAETAGAWGLVECLARSRSRVEGDKWPEFTAGLAELDLASRLISCHLNPDLPRAAGRD